MTPTLDTIEYRRHGGTMDLMAKIYAREHKINGASCEVHNVNDHGIAYGLPTGLSMSTSITVSWQTVAWYFCCEATRCENGDGNRPCGREWGAE